MRGRDDDTRRRPRDTSRSRSRECARADHHERNSVVSRSSRRSRSEERSSSRKSVRERRSGRSRSGSNQRSPSTTRISAKEDRTRRRSRSGDNATKPKRSRSRSRSRDHHRRRHRHRSSSISESDSSDSESSSSGSDSDDDRKRSKSKRSHTNKDGKKKTKKHKKDDRKKDKKKKKKKEKKKKKSSSSHAVNQNAYGKYGILRESDFHTKSQSFQAWLRDIKGVTELNGPKWEAMEMFKEYMEDYNTATMPHEKYYDIEKYEMQKYQKEQQKRAKHQLDAMDKAVPDEAAYQRERHAQRLAREQEDFKLVLQTMNKSKIEAMRRQEELRAQMQMQYKAGNVAEARRLEQLLRADEEDKRAK